MEWTAGLREDSQWSTALRTLLEEAWRLVLHGAQTVEVEAQLKIMRTNLESAYAERHDVESDVLASRFQAHFLNDGLTTAHVADGACVPSYLTRPGLYSAV